MTSIEPSPLENSFFKLSPCFYQKSLPFPLSNPHLVHLNTDMLPLLGLDEELLENSFLTDICAGKKLWPNSKPLAMVYAGHQFGVYNPQLGDGRSLLLGEIVGPDHIRRDLHLKGAGPTPYARHGDGRAVLRSTIREYLASESLYHLGIPTSRALCMVVSDTPVYREKVEQGASLIRVSESHIRFGTFEYFYYTQQHDALRTLADYCISRYETDLEHEQGRYTIWLKRVIRKSAKLIAKWQAFGFSHGVMNTDNMSIIGQTFDYGPYGMMEQYDGTYICNHSDHTGRYAFYRQPEIGYWNCSCLAQALHPLIQDYDILKACLDIYPKAYTDEFNLIMRKKLGFDKPLNEDISLIKNLFKVLQLTKPDYSIFFRNLCSFKVKGSNSLLFEAYKNNELLTDWFKQYKKRLRLEEKPENIRHKSMRKNNPKYILRNYMAQQAIDKAEQEGDFSEIEMIMTLLKRPYDEQIEYDAYSKESPEWGKKLIISCSS